MTPTKQDMKRAKEALHRHDDKGGYPVNALLPTEAIETVIKDVAQALAAERDRVWEVVGKAVHHLEIDGRTDCTCCDSILTARDKDMKV